ncbi:MAG: YdbL family protein [Akkermansiaceae bacterium]|nr:YdbL family protein [Akkermansiaceae bacterium]
MKKPIAMLVAITACFFVGTPASQADNASELKARMEQRLNQVVALKQNGSVGENNLGYLTARKALSGDDAKLVAAENADRKAVYTIIAGKTHSSATTVGKTRAASIRKSAPKGTWVQLADGSWKEM